MLNLLKIELRKLKTSKILYFFILLNMLQGITIYLFSERLSTSTGMQTLSFTFFLQISLSLGIFIGIFGVEVVCSEFTSGYMKNLIAYGNKRRDIFLAKAISAYIGMCFITFIPPIIMAFVNTYKNGFGETFTISSFLYIAGVLLHSLLVHITIGSIAVVISFLVRKSMVGSVIMVGIDFLNRILNIIHAQEPNMRGILNKFPYMQLTVSLAEEASKVEVIQSSITAVCTIVISTILGIYIFNRSDI